MKATELRIGNKVFDALGDVVSIDLILISNVEFMKLKPIPITEGWILDFGFKKQKTTQQNTYCKRTKKSQLWFFLYETGETIDYNDFQYSEPEIWYTFRNNDYGVKLKYVHELQNLFFALTGEELEINQNTESDGNQ